MPVPLKANRKQLAPASHAVLCAKVDDCIQRRLADCPYEFYFNRVTWHFEDGRLTLRGYVPTFYMKQILQTILRDMEHVEYLVNDVDVVSTTGLSSFRPK